MRHRNPFETFYAMYSPLLMLVGNIICGLYYLHKVYFVVNYLSIFLGYSFIFIPQFFINCKKYRLCKYYKGAVTLLSISMVVNLLYQVGLIGSSYFYIRLSLIINILGSILYFFIKVRKRSV